MCRWILLGGTLVFLFVGGCTPSSQEAHPAQLGELFKVGYNERVSIVEGLQIEFIELIGDSRCPDDALCPWEGEATITVRLVTEQSDSVMTDLRIRGFLSSVSQTGHEAVSANGYTITLKQLDPYPLITHSEPKQRYVATLIVKKNES